MKASIKKYMVLSVSYLSIILGASAYAQDHPDMPESIAPDNMQTPDPNKVMKNAKEGKVIPEQIKPMDDTCADELNKSELETGKPPVSNEYKQNCPKKNQYKHKSKAARPKNSM